MQLKYHYAASPGYTQLVTPQTDPIQDLDFGMLKLEGGQSYQANSASLVSGWPQALDAATRLPRLRLN